MKVERLRALMLEYPGVSEAPSYGTPGFRVRKKLLARLHQSEPAVVLFVGDLDEQEALMEMDPEVFYITDHYAGHPWVLAKISKLRIGQLRSIFEAAWRSHASRAQIEALEAR